MFVDVHVVSEAVQAQVPVAEATTLDDSDDWQLLDTSSPQAGGSSLETGSAESFRRYYFGDSPSIQSPSRAIEADFKAPDVEAAVPVVVSDGSSDEEGQGSSKRRKTGEAEGPVAPSNLAASGSSVQAGGSSSPANAAECGLLVRNQLCKAATRCLLSMLRVPALRLLLAMLRLTGNTTLLESTHMFT